MISSKPSLRVVIFEKKKSEYLGKNSRSILEINDVNSYSQETPKTRLDSAFLSGEKQLRVKIVVKNAHKVQFFEIFMAETCRFKR